MAAKKAVTGGGTGRDPLAGVDDEPPAGRTESSDSSGDTDTEDEDDDEGPEIEPEEPPATRQERRRNRYREEQQKREAAEADRDRYRQEADLHRQRADQYAQQRPASQEQTADPYATELEGIWEEQEGLTARWNGLSDEEKQRGHAEYIRKARTIDEKRHAVIARRELDRRGLGNQNPNQHIIERIRMEHPDVAGDERAIRWSQGYVAQKQAEGRAVDWPLIQEAMQATRVAFKMPGATRPAPRAAPTRDQQARYTSPSQSAGSAGPSKTVVKMGKHQRAQAEARFPNDAPKVAWQKWANTAGKKLVQG